MLIRFVCQFLLCLAVLSFYSSSPQGKAEIRSPELSPMVPRQSPSKVTIQATGPQASIWEGDSGGLHIKWTTHGLSVKGVLRTEDLLTPLVQKGFEDFARLYTADDGNIEDCAYERGFKVLSVVGTAVSIEDNYFDYCGGAHPSGGTRFTTIDLAKPGGVFYATLKETPMMDVDLNKPGRIALLTDYFPEADILEAILADKAVQAAIADLPGTPRELKQLPQLFAKDYYELGDSGFELRPDFLTRFAFHHLEAGKVAVRLGLPGHSGFNRSQHMQIGLLLPIPEALRGPLALAAGRKQGFLMKDEAVIGREQETVLSVKTRNSVKTPQTHADLRRRPR